MDSSCEAAAAAAENSQFFDAMEQIPAPSGSSLFRKWEYGCGVWVSNLQSVKERRENFIRWMGLPSNGLERDYSTHFYDGEEDFDRIMQNGGAVLRNSSAEDEFSSCRSSMSNCSTGDSDSVREVDLHRDAICYENSDGSSECYMDGLEQNERTGKLVYSNFDELLNSSDSQVAQPDEKRMQRKVSKLKYRWMSKLRSMMCMMSANVRDDSDECCNFNPVGATGARRVGVHHCRRRLKEITALFTGQEIQAHEGSILAMKFSPDGQYLASVGEDKVVRVWQVVQEARSDIAGEADSSCFYFSMNQLSELEPLIVRNDDINKCKTSLKSTSNSTCVVYPPKVFRILEEPLHAFQGHDEEILDLSWSKNNFLLSASVDKTVRLWRVGFDGCLKVFLHSDYVTCVQFNPLDDDYFISGSIDGKVRIWNVNECQVVDWIETKDIITAVSYRPDGQGGTIGSITGTCRFFNISDCRLQLETQICLANKKSICKRISGFQFSQQDPGKVLVACADSQVRIIDGTDVIEKYKGHRNSGILSGASFTADEKHIVSVSDDSNVYVWNYNGHGSSLSRPRLVRSFESFSSDASIVIPWCGLKTGISEKESPFSLSSYFSFGQDMFLDSSPKGSATWPEEKLPTMYNKSHYNLVKTCWQSCSSSSQAWGLVLVTASWDGKIRSFHNYGLPMPV